MSKKSLTYLILGIILLSITQKAIAEESEDRIYHFVFKVEKNISISENEAIFQSLMNKTDMLEVKTPQIKRDRNMYIVTYKTKIKPEDIIAKIQADKFPTPLMLLTYFVCDVTKDKKNFPEEFTSTEIKNNNAANITGGQVVEPVN